MRQARHKGGWDGAQLLFKVIFVFPTLRSEGADERWQELRGRLLPVTLLKVPVALLVSEPSQHWPRADPAFDDGNGPCARGCQPWVRGAWSHGLIPTQ